MKIRRILCAAIILPIVFVMFAAFTCGKYPDTDGEQTTEDLINRVKSGVVQVDCGGKSGSGFVTDSGEGCIIVTNFHVVDSHIKSSAQIAVFFEGASESNPATLLGYSRTYDIAVLKTSTKPANFHIFSSGGDSGVGEDTISLGRMNGNICAYDGMVSAREKLEKVESEYNDFLYLTEVTAPAPIGTSGGPCINLYGNIVGVNAFSNYTDGGEVGALSYKIPISTVNAIVSRILAEDGEKVSISLGFSLFLDGTITITCLDGIFSVIPTAAGLEVTSSQHQTLKQGDIIKRINGLYATTTVLLGEIITTQNNTIIEI